jgi:uncharacterized membrane protein YfcA
MFGIDLSLLASLLALGCFTGFLAGLLGIGGGMLMVPFMTMLFTAQHFSLQHVVHMAVATSLATILFTSISSIRAHHARGAVRWDIVRWLAPLAFVGTVVGAQFASQLKTPWLALFFGLFVGYSALQMLSSKKVAASKTMPRNGVVFGVGGLIGFVSSLVGAGGGFITVPFLSSRNVPLHQAVASSAAMGLPIAAGGLLGYIVSGQNVAGLPSGAWGYIYAPALFGCAVTSVLFAPIGAKVAHTLPVAQLKKIFAGLLLMLAAYMLYKSYLTFQV